MDQITDQDTQYSSTHHVGRIVFPEIDPTVTDQGGPWEQKKADPRVAVAERKEEKSHETEKIGSVR